MTRRRIERVHVTGPLPVTRRQSPRVTRRANSDVRPVHPPKPTPPPPKTRPPGVPETIKPEETKPEKPKLVRPVKTEINDDGDLEITTEPVEPKTE